MGWFSGEDKEFERPEQLRNNKFTHREYQNMLVELGYDLSEGVIHDLSPILDIICKLQKRVEFLESNVNYTERKSNA